MQETRDGDYVLGASADGYNARGDDGILQSSGNTMHLYWESDDSVAFPGFEVREHTKAQVLNIRSNFCHNIIFWIILFLIPRQS